jgi:hypothetical protein
MHASKQAVSLEHRIRRLEVTNRFLLLGVIVMAALFLIAGQKPTETARILRAQSLEIVNEQGAVRARLSATEAGGEFVLLDAAAIQRASLQHDGADTALYLRDQDGTTRIGVAQFAHGGGGFALHGAESKGAAVLYRKGDKGSLSFYDADGTLLHRFPDAPPEVRQEAR